MDRKTRNVLGGVLVAALLLTVLQVHGLVPSVSSAGTQLLSMGVRGPLPATDPESALWDEAVPLAVPLSAQAFVAPIQTAPTVHQLEVRSLNNGTHIAFRLTWADATKDNATTRLQEFRDAVAVQVGLPGSLPYLCMGGANVRMDIMQWKADWQADIEEGFRDLQDAFPNFWVDYYPYAMGEPPYEVPEDFAGNASDYLVGYAVGNPFSQPLKVTPVEDALAYGYFTITTQRQQDAIGRGVWRDGTWSVVISRKMDTGDPQDHPITSDSVLAFAVWDGANGDRGARKSTATWVPLVVRPLPSETPDPVVIAAVVVIALPLLILLFRRRKPEAPRPPPPPEGRKP